MLAGQVSLKTLGAALSGRGWSAARLLEECGVEGQLDLAHFKLAIRQLALPVEARDVEQLFRVIADGARYNTQYVCNQLDPESFAQID